MSVGAKIAILVISLSVMGGSPLLPSGHTSGDTPSVPSPANSELPSVPSLEEEPSQTSASRCVACLVGNISVPGGAVAIAVDPLNDQLFAENSSGGVDVIDGSNNTLVATLPTPQSIPSRGPDTPPPPPPPYDSIEVSIEFDPWNDLVYAGGPGGIEVISPRSDRPLIDLPTQGSVDAMAYDARTGTLFYAAVPDFEDCYGGYVGVLSVGNGSPAWTLDVGNCPTSLALDPASDVLYVGYESTANVSAFNASNGTPLASIDVNTQVAPNGEYGTGSMVIAGEDQWLYFANEWGGSAPANLTVISTEANEVVSTTRLPLLYVGGIAVDNATGDVWVSGTGVSDGMTVAVSELNDSVEGMFYAGNSTLFFWMYGIVYDAQNGQLYACQFGGSIVAFEDHIPPPPTAARILPSTSLVTTDSSVFLESGVLCGNGPCPPGLRYAWFLNNGLGNLTGSNTPSVDLIAGNVSGWTTLYLRVSFDGTSVVAPPLILNLQASVGSVGLVLGSSGGENTVLTNTTQIVGAQVDCLGGPCPTDLTYLWSVSNGLVALNATDGSSVRLSAGSRPGTTELSVRVTQGSSEVSISVPLQVKGAPPLAEVSYYPPVTLALSWVLIYAGLGALGGLLSLALLLGLPRFAARREREEIEPDASPRDYPTPPPGSSWEVCENERVESVESPSELTLEDGHYP